VAKLTAPYTPFIADELYTNLTGPDPSAPDSVHLTDWPAPDDARRDDDLRRRMVLVRRLVAVGRAARTEAGVRVRQPLQRALVVLPAADAAALDGLEGLIAEELNVRAVEPARGLEELVSYEIKPNFRALGPRLGAGVKELAAALADADAPSLVARLEHGEPVTLEVGGEPITVEATDLDVRVAGRAGLSFAQDGPYGVALDVAITPELRAEGIAREVVRSVQNLRKSSGLAVEDRIEMWLTASGEEGRAALRAHAGYIGEEVLASELRLDQGPPQGVPATATEVEGETIAIALRREPDEAA
jgi:isoleucyl-tRNA synthetase